MGIDKTRKIFIVSKGYGDLIRELENRGYIENEDKMSSCFHIKWVIKGRDIKRKYLASYQIINHFIGAQSLTTKVGLCKTLRSLIYFNDIDIDTFYPICFDLNNVEDYQDFVEEYKAH